MSQDKTILRQIRRTVRDTPAIALIVGALLGPPPGLDPPPNVEGIEAEE